MPHLASTREDAHIHNALEWLGRAATSNHPDPRQGSLSAQGPERQGWGPFEALPGSTPA